MQIIKRIFGGWVCTKCGGIQNTRRSCMWCDTKYSNLIANGGELRFSDLTERPIYR